MIIGTVRPEEARAFDSEQGCHQFKNDECTFEVFWHNGGIVEDGLAEGQELPRAGWYWCAIPEGCMPDSETTRGPFARSSLAKDDALGE